MAIQVFDLIAAVSDSDVLFHLFSSDLIFSFVDELQADQTPETVHLMPQGIYPLCNL